MERPDLELERNTGLGRAALDLPQRLAGHHRDAAVRGVEQIGAEERELHEARAAARLRALEQDHGSSRASATARLDLENIRRLGALRDQDARALDELSSLAEALRTQIVLARFSGSSAADVGGIVSEVWARVEGLGAALEAEEILRAEEPIET